MAPLTIVGIALSAGLTLATLVMVIRLRNVPRQPTVYSRWSDASVWLRGIGLLTFVIFFAFCYVSETRGGDAWNGFIRGGHYFLGRKGGYTETTHEFWKYSHYHLLSVWLLFFCTLIAFAWASPEQKPPGSRK